MWGIQEHRYPDIGQALDTPPCLGNVELSMLLDVPHNIQRRPLFPLTTRGQGLGSAAVVDAARLGDLGSGRPGLRWGEECDCCCWLGRLEIGLTGRQLTRRVCDYRHVCPGECKELGKSVCFSP